MKNSLYLLFIIVCALFLNNSQAIATEENKIITLFANGETTERNLIPNYNEYKIVCYTRFGGGYEKTLYLYGIDSHAMLGFYIQGFRVLSYLGHNVYGNWYQMQVSKCHEDKKIISSISQPITVRVSANFQIGDEIFHKIVSSGNEWKADAIDFESAEIGHHSPKLSYLNNSKPNITIFCSQPFMLLDISDISILDNFWNFGFEVLSKEGSDSVGWSIYKIRIFSDDANGTRSIVSDQVLMRTPQFLKVQQQVLFQVEKMDIWANNRLIHLAKPYEIKGKGKRFPWFWSFDPFD